MKRLVLIAVAAFFSVTASAQEGFSGGVNVGLTISEISDWKFSIQVDLEYNWEATETIDLGVAAGYGNIFGGDVDGFDLPDYKYIPIAATASFEFGGYLNFEADLGYAIGLDDVDGGFYYRPGLSYDVSETFNIGGYYTGISDDGFTASTISLGARFRF